MSTSGGVCPNRPLRGRNPLLVFPTSVPARCRFPQQHRGRNCGRDLREPDFSKQSWKVKRSQQDFVRSTTGKPQPKQIPDEKEILGCQHTSTTIKETSSNSLQSFIYVGFLTIDCNTEIVETSHEYKPELTYCIPRFCICHIAYVLQSWLNATDIMGHPMANKHYICEQLIHDLHKHGLP